jgi:hypothetical protein
MSVLTAPAAPIRGHGGTTARRLLETVTSINFDGATRSLPRAITLIQYNGTWILDDPLALTYAAEASYPEALADYIDSLTWLRDELADATHPANRHQHAAVVDMLTALGR